MVIAMPSTPASYFHLIRRHALQKIKKPLVVFTPKSLLRNKLAVSSLSDIDETSKFFPVIEAKSSGKVEKVIFCSGKIYYDLIEHCDNRIAIVRIEQFYPFPENNLETIIANYSGVKDFVWCQEEPKNMGAFGFVSQRIRDVLTRLNKNADLKYVGREDEASPATGYLNTHNEQQNKIIQQALSI
jgi:2-oxoglutarate dehydrogenase E1 component